MKCFGGRPVDREWQSLRRAARGLEVAIPSTGSGTKFFSIFFFTPLREAQDSDIIRPSADESGSRKEREEFVLLVG